MDSNGAQFWRIGGAGWASADDPDRVGVRAERLTLTSQAPAPELDEDEAQAIARRDAVPPATDALGARTVIRPDPGGDALVVHLDGVLDRDILTVPIADGRIDGVAIDPEGVITVAAAGALWLRDARTVGDPHEAWRLLDAAALAGAPGPFAAWRVAPRPDGGAWALDRANRALATWTGAVVRRAPDRVIAPGTFRPDPETPELVAARVHPDGFDGDEPVALAVAADGSVAVLAWTDGEARVHWFDGAGRVIRRFALAGLRRPYGLAFDGLDRLATLAVTAAGAVADALVYPAVRDSDDPRVLPVGDRYPLRRHDGAAWWVPSDGGPVYGTASGGRTLRALSLPLRASVGRAVARSPLDSGRIDTCWHRLYVEAVVPPGCGARIELAASDQFVPPDDAASWHPHDVGAVPRGVIGDRATTAAGDEGVVVGRDGGTLTLQIAGQLLPASAPITEVSLARPPRATWIPAASELANHPGGLGCAPSPDRAGLFTTLIARTRCRSTRLVGRYLHARVTLFGTGRATPELGELRAYGPRFSYVREYLPELYHEDAQIDGSDERGSATGADFFERFVALFEGVLTPIEDRVAEGWQWTAPETIPADSLDWLAAWVGLTLDPALPEPARRRMISLAPVLARWQGTLRGVQLLLDVVTDGGSARGDVIVVEDWRLRRTWATILGADLTDDTDPLLLGLAVDANSIVGDTLILGDEHHREFLALFGPGIDATTADRAAVDAFFEASAHRVTVLVQESLGEDRIGLVERAVATGVPAHVFATVRRSSRSFIAGVSALVGVDTRLGEEPPVRTVRLGHTRIGEGDRVRRPGVLHPDVEGDR